MRKSLIKIISGITVCLVAAVLIFAGLNIPENKEKFNVKQPENVVKTDLKIEPKMPKKQSKAPVKERVKTDISLEETEQTKKVDKESISETTLSCTLSVRCDKVLENLDMLAEGKEKIIPFDGIIYPEQTVGFSDGESVFDVLFKELKKSNIHFEFVKTPMYNSAYIEGIGNLYEFDCGDYSGWIYKVNGVKPIYGCSQYKLKDNDKVEFIYSCNFVDNED